MASDSPQSSIGTPSKPSGRKGSRKVRTGCITCKTRKVKCDETKPACLRCVKTGRKCDGYTPLTPPAGRSSLALSPSATPEFESPEEFRAFDYYRTRSAPLIGSAMDLDFWAGLVVKLSVREPVVRHAMLALSSLHEALDSGGPEAVGFQRSFALTEYGKAISTMRRWDSQTSSEVVPLLVCLLFVCIEFLLGDDVSSQLHISQGREILFRLENTPSPEMAMVRRYLVPVFMRLSLPGFFRASRPAPIPSHLVDHTAVPQEFGTIDEARSMLYYLMDETLRLTVQGKPAVYNPNMAPEEWVMLRNSQQRIASQLSNWNIGFIMLIASMPASQSQAVADMQKMLQILYESALIWVSTALQPLELTYDSHITSFAAIVSHASAIIQTSLSHASRKLFSFETELIAPLYWTAVKCRHPLLRRTALRLLMKEELKNRRENIWAAETTIAVAARVIELEESGLVDAPTPRINWERFFAEAGSNLDFSPGVQFENLDYHAGSTSHPHSHPQQRQQHQQQQQEQRHNPHHNEIFGEELNVPVTQPPTIPVSELEVPADWGSDDGLDDVPAIVKETLVSLRRKFHEPRPFVPEPIEPAPHMTVNLEITGAESPFGIPEAKRIKNTIIGPVQDGGVWITVFRDARDGSGTWDITREFLRQ